MRAHVPLIAALAVAGCGGDDPAPPPGRPAPQPALSAPERTEIRRLESRIQRHCVRLASSLVDPENAPTAAQERAAFAAADELVARAARTPRAPLGAGQDLRLFVSDVVENLEGSNCDRRLVAVLERGLAGIPVE